MSGAGIASFDDDVVDEGGESFWDELIAEDFGVGLWDECVSLCGEAVVCADLLDLNGLDARGSFLVTAVDDEVVIHIAGENFRKLVIGIPAISLRG